MFTEEKNMDQWANIFIRVYLKINPDIHDEPWLFKYMVGRHDTRSGSWESVFIKVMSIH